MIYLSVLLPERLANELKNIDWSKVSDKDIDKLIKFGVPFLKLKGYIKKGVKNNG